MAANYLHGPETIEVENGARPVRTVRSAVVSLIGIAPVGDISTLVQCLSEKDAAAFGSQFTGFTIPRALDAIYDRGADTVLIINVLNLAKHRTAVKGEVATFDESAGQARLAHPVVTNVVMKDSEDSTTHTANMGYRVDARAGVFTDLSKATKTGSSAKVNCEYADPLRVTVTNIIGGVNNTGNRTNMKLLNDSSNLYDCFTRILIVPVFCTQKSIVVELIAMTEKLGAITYIDVPVGTTFTQALVGRGPESTINFNTSSDHVRLCYPRVKVYDLVTNTEHLEPLSQRTAGLCAGADLGKGHWWSSSNQEILGITGVERQLSAIIGDLQSEVNLLNEQGITTVLSSYGSGLRLWDNRVAAWPTVTHTRNFEDVCRTGDVINESIRYLSQQYIDMPITWALIDALTESVSAYGRKMTDDGAVLGFRCWFDPTRNPEMGLVAGHLLLSYKYTSPPPLERSTSETEITSEYLLTPKGGN